MYDPQPPQNAPQSQAPPQQQPTNPVPPLTNQQKTDWNSFLDFVDKEGFKGNTLLDDKDKQMGQYLMQKYRTLNPKSTITYQDVPRVQSELQQYRTDALKQIHSGQAQAPMKDEEFMAGLSPVDGWLGSQTSSHKFPVATGTNTTMGKTTTQNYGTDIASFDKNYVKPKGK